MELARKSSMLSQMLCTAATNGIVVPAFNVPYLPMVAAVARAVSKCDAFSMIQVARLELTKFQAESLSAIAREYRRHADPEVVTLHLDHTPVIDEDEQRVDWETLIAEAISIGYDSVMIDGSRLPLEQNIAVTRRVVEMAHPHGIMVEGELGAVMGHELGPLPPYEELFSSRMGFTDPEDARVFVRGTSVDWLSVSIGSIHGAISPGKKDKQKVQARLDITRLRELRKATGIPLVLHGGSGIGQKYIDDAIKNGIAKINVATDIRQPYERALAADGVAYAQEAVEDAVTKLVRDVYHIQGSATRLRELVEKSR